MNGAHRGDAQETRAATREPLVGRRLAHESAHDGDAGEELAEAPGLQGVAGAILRSAYSPQHVWARAQGLDPV